MTKVIFTLCICIFASLITKASDQDSSQPLFNILVTIELGKPITELSDIPMIDQLNLRVDETYGERGLLLIDPVQHTYVIQVYATSEVIDQINQIPGFQVWANSGLSLCGPDIF